jgi:sulfate transport system substrate-binding protein
VTIRAEPPVTLVDANVDAKGTRKVAEAYLEFLYSPAAQAIMAKHFYRPFRPDGVAPEDLARFAKVKEFTIGDFGGWSAVQDAHFADGGVFDQLMKAGRP